MIFVIQKHHARQLHYDFRLEVDGVLKSWSVPKGPSLNPAEKHLAVMVEDHPLEYAAFEGIIPKGEYGGGEVIIWDNGTYSPENEDKVAFDDRSTAEEQMRLGLEKGKLSFTLHGHKLKGSWTLVKMKKTGNNWLLMKHRDKYAKPDGVILAEDKSVVSGRTIEDIKERRSPFKKTVRHIDPKKLEGAFAAEFPSGITPMLASLSKQPFSDPAWIFEPKLDGYRIITYIRDGKVAMFTRNNNNVTAKFAALMPDLESQSASDLVFDGEIIAMDEKGKQCFQCLQDYLSSLRGAEKGAAKTFPLVYYVFDILYLNGYDLRAVSLRERKALLLSILKSTDQVKLMDYFTNSGETVYKAAVDNGLEGIVAKKLDSKYESGIRSDNWMKIKSMLTDEFIVGGYSIASGGREKTLSSLLLGYYDEKGKLIFAGHVGSGFSENILNELKQRLDSIRIKKCPFSEIPGLNAPTTWVKPEVVVEVKFSEWTKDGRLRIPIFLRLRDDKKPEEIKGSNPVLAPDPPKRVKGDGLANIIERLQEKRDEVSIEVDGNKFNLGNLDKIIWPATVDHRDFTKRDLLIYLVKVSPYLLPHLQDRPLTLSRYPDGIFGEHFYQKHWGHPVPEFVQKVEISEEKGSKSEYLICNNTATLLWLGQVADIELHSWFSRISAEPDMAKRKSTDYILDYPDFLIFDLDPYIYSGKEKSGDEPELNRQGFSKVCDVALWLKEVLDDLAASAFVKTSGKTGLHIYVPITCNLDYKEVRSVAEMIGRFLLQKHPDEITMEWATEKRAGKVFVDYGQNVRGKTLASIYSPRNSPAGSVSTPLRWAELKKVYPEDFTLITLPDRLKKTGDLWADIITAKKDLKKLLKLK